MQDDVPDGARRASRVILIGPNQSILYLRAQEPRTRNVFWVMPGGGLDSGETFEDAARRELVEEAGCDFLLGPYVWFRRHKHEWNGRPVDQYERFFVAHAESLVVAPQHQDGYISRHRWWSLEELKASKEDFAPKAVAKLLTDILNGNYPKEPIDCGI
jgi:8-oxo-dGTP pyrophosphatase MutT (NUDIX family)